MTLVQIPIFPSSDFDRTAAFYGTLDFTEANRFGDYYLILEHDVGMELHFYGAGRVKTKSNDHAAYIRFDTAAEADALYDAWAPIAESDGFAVLSGKAGRIVHPSDTDYGLREFALLDVDGNLIRIGGSLPG